MKKILSTLIILCGLASTFAWAKADNDGLFSGRVSKINDKAELLQIHATFANMKYLNKNDLVEFFNDNDPRLRCRGTIVGKSPEYLLLKLQDYEYCLKRMHLAVGGYLKFESVDLANNIKMGREIMSILLKKRLAVNGRLNQSKQQLESHLNKVDAINKRYELLRQKLELEWQKELSDLEEDRIVSLRNYKALELRIAEIEQKIEQYKVEDENLEIDRWALDSTLYYKK